MQKNNPHHDCTAHASHLKVGWLGIQRVLRADPAPAPAPTAETKGQAPIRFH